VSAVPVTISIAPPPAARAEVPSRTLKVCLVNPKFEPSYWGFEHSLPMYPGDRRSTMINGALPTLAGLSAPHDVTILDENVEDIDWNHLASFDVVGVTGMNVQRRRMKEILLRLKGLDVMVAVGGPLVSVEEAFFEGLFDAMFVGEAEYTWPGFLTSVANRRETQGRYEQSERTDMTTTPPPRFDLLKVNRYASGAVQFSRGCPFRCEFCDIIVIFGRRPRVKKPEQVLTELEDMRKAGFHLAMIVDDNFIGNKKEAKLLLREIIKWQKQHGYPLRLNTEASLNLADDEELLELMYQANFRSVFIGIETPRLASLEETLKTQNTRGDSMEEKLARIQNAGLDISAGFIIGFDNDDMAIFEEQYRFIQDNGILLAMVGMLGAIPRTPLYARLEKEGRLLKDDAWGCNFIPKQMSREVLQKNYWDLVSRLYTPEAFLDRYFRSYESYPEFRRRRAEMSEKCGEGTALPTIGYGVILLFNLIKTLAREGSLTNVGKVYLNYYFKRTKNLRPRLIASVMFLNRCVTHWHFYKFTRDTLAGQNAAVKTSGMNG
jgi:radical SAM superfamily enzyme YgiQ (UPF0313 family)